MKNGIRNIGIYMAVILLVVCGIYYFMSQNTKKDDYTYRDFVKDYNASNIAEIKLYQYKEQPTGKMLIELKDGKKHTIQISSVADTESRLIDLNAEYTVSRIEKESIIVLALPYIAMVIIALVFTSMMTAQTGGGGGGKMMNFSKSHAKLATDMNKQVTFDEQTGNI